MDLKKEKGNVKAANLDVEDNDEEPDKYNFKPFKLKGEISFMGLILYFILCAAFIAYIVIRAIFTLNLLVFTPYAIIVFIFEIIFGFVTLIVYSPMTIYTK